MKLGEMLRTVGGKLGLVRVVDMNEGAGGGAPAKVTTRTIALGDLATEIRKDEVRTLAEMPAELSVPFEKVFDAAGIKPPAHGWTVERIAELLNTEQYKAMDRVAVQRALLGLLSTQKAQVEDIVKDASSRDQALDAYDTFVHKKMEDRAVARERKIAEMKAQIRDLEKQCTQQAEESQGDQDRLRAWLERKAAMEEEMAHSLSFLLDHPVVSVTRLEPKK